MKKTTAKKSAATSRKTSKVSAPKSAKTTKSAKAATGKKTAAKKPILKKSNAKPTKTPTKKIAKKTAKKTVKSKSAIKNALKKSDAKIRKLTPKTLLDETDSAENDPDFIFVKKCWQALDDKKAEDLKVLDVRGKSPITNYFIIATATSEPHLKALANELEKTLKADSIRAVGRDYQSDSGWMVVDAFDFMAHIFLREQRGLYGIESLWKDAKEVDMQ